MKKRKKKVPIVLGNRYDLGGPVGGGNIYNIQPIQPQLLNVPQANMPSAEQISAMMQNTLQNMPHMQPQVSSPNWFQRTNANIDKALQPIGGMSGALGIAGGAINLGSQIAGNLKVPKAPEVDMNANTKGDLLNRATNFQGHDLGRTNTAMSGVNGAMTGATAGMALGPIGAAVGGVVGGIGGAISSIFGNKKKKKAERKANRKVINQINAQNQAINAETISQSIGQEFAYGGLMNQFAYGGGFSNGITYFNEGGTHEENPFGGVFQGMGDNGMPNLVEEGEVKWNDYIFSDRLITPEDIKEYNLPSNIAGKSFADAVDYLQKESKEREIDPISRRGLETNLTRLAQVQEGLKEQQQGTEGMNQFEEGGSMIGESPRWKKRNTSTSNSNMYNAGSLQEQLQQAYQSAGVTNPAMIKALIAQDMLESGWGKSVQGKYNFGNITGGKGYKGKTMSGRDRDGSGKPITQRFREYDSMQDYANDKIALLKRRYDFNQDDDINTFADKLSGNNSSKYRYAEDKNYSNVLKSVFNGDTKVRPASYVAPEDDLQSNIDNGGPQLELPSTASNPINPIAQTATQTFTQSDIDKARLEGQQSSIALAQEAQTKAWQERNLELDERASAQQEKLQELAGKPNYLRYAPLFTNMGLLTSSLTSKPDRLSLGRIAPQMLGERMKYNPMDSEYVANQLRQQAAATRRSLVDTSGGNRGIAQAALLAANKGSQEAIGDALFKVNELNDNKLNRVKEFNRQTDQFNIGNDFKAQEYNTNALNQERMWNKQADASKRNEVRQGFAGIGNILGQIGTENRNFKLATILGGGYNSMGTKGDVEKGLFQFLANGGHLNRVYKKKIK